MEEVACYTHSPDSEYDSKSHITRYHIHVPAGSLIRKRLNHRASSECEFVMSASSWAYYDMMLITLVLNRNYLSLGLNIVTKSVVNATKIFQISRHSDYIKEPNACKNVTELVVSLCSLSALHNSLCIAC